MALLVVSFKGILPLAVPLPVITLLSALLFIVVPAPKVTSASGIVIVLLALKLAGEAIVTWLVLSDSNTV